MIVRCYISVQKGNESIDNSSESLPSKASDPQNMEGGFNKRSTMEPGNRGSEHDAFDV